MDNTKIRYPGNYDTGEIVKISFPDTLDDAPTDAWDFSKNQDSSVLAWLNENKTHLYVAGNGGVDANEKMDGMFDGFSSLTEIDFSALNASNVTSMQNMFLDCTSLTRLNLSTFDTSNVKNMDCMFKNCYSLTDLDLSNFNTSGVLYMKLMFDSFSSLSELDISGFDMSNAYTTDMFKNTIWE